MSTITETPKEGQEEHLTIRKVAYSGKWVKIYLYNANTYLSCKGGTLHHLIDEADLNNEVMSTGLSGMMSVWVYKGMNWELKQIYK